MHSPAGAIESRDASSAIRQGGGGAGSALAGQPVRKRVLDIARAGPRIRCPVSRHGQRPFGRKAPKMIDEESEMKPTSVTAIVLTMIAMHPSKGGEKNADENKRTSTLNPRSARQNLRHVLV